MVSNLTIIDEKSEKIKQKIQQQHDYQIQKSQRDKFSLHNP